MQLSVKLGCDFLDLALSAERLEEASGFAELEETLYHIVAVFNTFLPSQVDSAHDRRLLNFNDWLLECHQHIVCAI